MENLKRTLGFGTTLAIIAGGVIGSGIFMKPAVMAQQLGSPVLLVAVWIIAGLITLCGALSNAEAAAMFPETGGQYIFFQKMYGNGFAFLYGWAALTVFNTAGNASIAYVCSQYTGYFISLPRFNAATEHAFQIQIPFIGTIFPLENIGVKGLTIFMIILLTLLNYLSLQQAGALQRILTALKVAAIVFLILGLFFSQKGSVHNMVTPDPGMPAGWPLIRACMAAMAGAFWAYDGWNNITFIAGEIKDPQRNIPKSLLASIVICISVYVLVNLALVYVLPVTILSHSSYAAADAATVSWGVTGGSIVTLMVVLSTLGSANANVLSTARVTFAMGKENKWLGIAGRVHPTYRTPANALLINAAWSILLIFSGSFDMLTDMLIFVSWFFYGMSALGIFILRVKMKDTDRPYRVWGYPVVPLIFISFTAFFLCSTVYSDVVNYQQGTTHVLNSLFGVLIVMTGLPVYLFSGKRITARDH